MKKSTKILTNSTKALGKRVATYFEQDFEGTVEGPHAIGPYRISRIWTHDPEEDEYHAHYAVEDKGNESYFDNFSPFAIWLGEKLTLDDFAGRSERETRLGMAALVIFVALGLLIYLVVWAPGREGVINYLLAAVVGAASSYVFLKRPPKKPE